MLQSVALSFASFLFLSNTAFGLDHSIPIKIGDRIVSPTQTLDTTVTTEQSTHLMTACDVLLSDMKRKPANSEGRSPELRRNIYDLDLRFTSLSPRFVPLIDNISRWIDIFDRTTDLLIRSVRLALPTVEGLLVSGVVSENGQYLAVVFTPNIPIGTTRSERLDLILSLPRPRLQLYDVRSRRLLRDTDYGDSRLPPMNLALLSNDGKTLVFEGQYLKRDFVAEQPRNIYRGNSALHFLNLDTMEISMTKEFARQPQVKNVKSDQYLALLSDPGNQIELFHVSSGVKISSIQTFPGYRISAFDFDSVGKRLAVTLSNGQLIPRIFMYDIRDQFYNPE